MQLSLERTGGFAGISRTINVDSDTLPLQVAEELSRLVASVNFFELPEQIISEQPQCDRFQYRLTIVDHDHQHTVILSEAALTSGLRTLIEYIHQTASYK